MQPVAEAKISVLDDGFLRGDGAFEVTRVYDGQPFALNEHLDRLENSATSLRLRFDRAALIEEVDKLVAAQGANEAALRLVVTRGGNRLAILAEVPQQPDSVSLLTVTYSPSRLLDGVKSLSYAANMLATRVAQEHEFDDALLVSPHGRVLEAPTASFFWAEQGVLYTPPLSERILDSITRRYLMKSVEVVEEICTLDRLKGIGEAFIASSVREVMPVSRIDETELTAPGPLTTQAKLALTKTLKKTT